ncbi:pilus assembly protein FimV [Paraburkholderia sp. LEh10]|uniref:FimV/HubP family polar landmark protein n=1 Tax=Paraburkholderia sp. LEh10 TaxID=2821353 RepID=UPI001AE1B2BD|nr:FimV/HubP family polar landmark protein [Paraburkholderia sp. LEh10]MBP0592077.1 pilus assembly protein FimV [Paraburkholderia sp. LEh10]
MTAQFQPLPAATRSGSHQIAMVMAMVFAGALSIPGAAYGQTAAASAASAASAPAGTVAGATQFTVQPGQSLNDAAIAMTQSHDRAVLARAAKAIFDANPNAFMGHDPSRLRLGAVLNLPPVDATGAPASAASAAGAASAPGATAQSANSASAATSAAASAVGEQIAPSTTPNAGVSAAAGAGASSPAAEVQGASTPSTAQVPLAPATGGQATSGAVAPSASAASGTHTWTGSIQGSESAATAPAASAANGAQPASQARPQVSSLQQLLALKNRVLMELQKHGIGKQQAASGNAVTAPTAAPGAGASASATQAAPSAAQPATAPTGIPQEYLGAAAIVGAGLVALLSGLTMHRRRKAARAAEAASEEVATANEAPAFVPPPVEPEEPTSAVKEPPQDTHRTAPAEAPATAVAPAPESGPKHEPETFDAAAAEAALAAAATLGADALPRESLDPARDEARAAEAIEQEQAAREQALTKVEPAADSASAGHSLDEVPILAEELREPYLDEPMEAPRDAPGAKTRKPITLELGPAPDTTRQEPAFEQPLAASVPPIQLSQEQPAAQHEQRIEPLPADQARGAQSQLHEAPDALPLGAPPPLEPVVPDEFPRDAMRALDSIDEFALPPRTESTAAAAPVGAAATPPVSLATQPVVAPEVTAQQAVPPSVAQPRAAADEIIAGTAGAAAVAGLGASRFGALKLDFDLELPPSPSQVVPAFTPEELARIARNKLDLAVEYIDLGDVVGARTLINEVIESNDAATRADARALLSTLAPLS